MFWMNTGTEIGKSYDASDVNQDEQVTSLDALIVINFLNRMGLSTVDLATVDATNEEYPPIRLDTTSDHRISALDALHIINRLNELDSVSPPSANEPEAFTTQLGSTEIDLPVLRLF